MDDDLFLPGICVENKDRLAHMVGHSLVPADPTEQRACRRPAWLGDEHSHVLPPGLAVLEQHHRHARAFAAARFTLNHRHAMSSHVLQYLVSVRVYG